MAVVTISTFGWNVIVPAGPRLPLAALGLLYLASATLGWRRAERSGERAIAVWLVMMIAQTIVALELSSLAVMLLTMPLIGLAVVYGSIRWGIVVTVLFLGFAAGWRALQGAPPVIIYTSSTGMIPGAIFTIVLGQLITRERSARRQLRNYATQVEDLATTRERNRIARDIHDSVGHYLTVVHVQLEAARALATKDLPAAIDCIERAQALARDGLAELRHSVSLLRSPGAEDRPFGAALDALIAESQRGGLDAELRVSGDPRTLAPAIEFTLYRCLQEALTNAVKHAQASRVTCELQYEERAIVLRVVDDGVGALTTEGGFGLIGLRERVELVGGDVRIATSAGSGFSIEVRVPA